MPEATEDAVFLIATSYQALGRVQHGIEETLTCDCTVVLIFAAFYIEANITHIIKEMGKYKEMKKFVEYRHPGLFPKLSWFFKEYVDPGSATGKDDFFENAFKIKLYKKFPGFEKIYNFRNGVAHGEIDQSLTNQTDAENLRAQAKDIVKELYKIAESKGHKIERAITYQIATSPSADPN